MTDLLDVNALTVTLPWLIPEAEATMAIMGKNFEPTASTTTCGRSRRSPNTCRSRG